MASRTATRLVSSLCVTLAIAGVLASCSSAGKHAIAPGTTAPATTASTSVPYGSKVALASEQRLSPLWAQGVARVPGGWVFSGTNGLWRTDDRLRVLAVNAPAIPAAWKARGFVHIGDIDVVGRYIYAPFEEPDYSKGHQATARYDRVSLRFVDAVVLPQHQNSFVTVDPATMTAYSMDEFDGNALLRYDVARGWKPLPPLRMSETLHHTQGADVGHGAIWISTDDAHHGVYRVDMTTGRVTEVGRMGHPGGEGEGLDTTDLASGFLHVLCVDSTLVPVWFEQFRVAS